MVNAAEIPRGGNRERRARERFRRQGEFADRKLCDCLFRTARGKRGSRESPPLAPERHIAAVPRADLQAVVRERNGDCDRHRRLRGFAVGCGLFQLPVEQKHQIAAFRRARRTARAAENRRAARIGFSPEPASGGKRTNGISCEPPEDFYRTGILYTTAPRMSSGIAIFSFLPFKILYDF